MQAIASGSLRGARGNSGVILSQLFRGFTRELAAAEGEIKIPQLTAALVRATETAYKAVMKPKEGTILTVARAMSDKAEELQRSATDILSFAREVIAAGDAALQQTPELFAGLKAGGCGGFRRSGSYDGDARRFSGSERRNRRGLP